MKQLLIVFFSLFIGCIGSGDKVIVEKVAEELGCSGTVGLYRTETDYSELHSFKKYFELQLDCPNLFSNFDTVSLRKAFAYRTYLKLSESDKKEYEAIKVIFKNDLKSELDMTSFFEMSTLETIYQFELVIRDYLKAIKYKNLDKIENEFDKEKFGYTNSELDSLNKSFLDFTKGKFEESRLINWATIEDADSKYKLLVFLTDSLNNYSSKFQFAMHDSLRNEKNIVTINY